jgi:hypothetical protein
MSTPTVDRPALRAYRLARVREGLKKHDYAGIVLFDSINIRYATDCTNMIVWTLHNPVHCVFVAAEGPVVLFEFPHCDHLSEGLGTVDEVRPAIAWTYFVNGPRVEEKVKVWAVEIADFVRTHGGGNTRLACDRLEPVGLYALNDEGISVHDGLEVMEGAKRSSPPTRSTPCAPPCVRASPSKPCGRTYTRRTSNSAAISSRPDCCRRGRAPTPGTRNAPTGRSRPVTSSPSTPT